jgi:hypothetical protein
MFHPLDTLQVLRQTEKKMPNVTLKRLYKGVGLKLLKQVPTMAVGYGVYGATKRYVENKSSVT